MDRIRIAAVRVLLFALGASIWLVSPLAAQESWTFLGLGSNDTKRIAIAPGKPSAILVAGTYLYVSGDGGATWGTESNVSSPTYVAFGSNQNAAFAGSWGGGVYKSIDACATWVQKNNGITNTVINSICVSPSDDSAAYAATQGGLFKTTNGGDLWTSIYSSINATAIAAAPTDAQTLYMGLSTGSLCKSTNGGTAWTPLTSPANSDCNDIAIDPTNANIVYAVFRWQGGWVSIDGGATWTQISPAFEGWSIAVDKLRSGFVYGVGGWSLPRRSGCYGYDGWHDMATSFDGSFTRAMAVDPNDSSKVYCCSPTGVRRWIADIAPPAAPGTLSATPQGNTIRLNWSVSGSPECTGYWIYRREPSAPYGPTPIGVVSGRDTTTFAQAGLIGGSTYFYKVAAIDAAQNHSAFTNEATATVASSVDLDVTYISRLPRDCYRYIVDYNNGVPSLRPGTENQKRWPAYGEKVSFVAHFVNKGTVNPGMVGYRWKVNGVVVGTGSVAGVAPGQEGTATIQWTWNVNGLDTDHSDQTVAFELDPDNLITETYRQNNILTDFLEGVTLYVYMEQQLYDAFNARVNLVGTFSAEDWLQGQVKSMNDNFARSTYPPLAPNGCLERIRIEKFVVGSPPASDNTEDGDWNLTGGEGYASYFALSIDGGLIHEWMHQIGIIDLYNYPVLAGGNVVVTPDGLPNGTTWAWGRPGIMAGGDITPHVNPPQAPAYVDQHSCIGLNKNVGYRRGYYGEYMFDIPTYNTIQINDSAGNPAVGATVRVFQANFGSVANTPVITGTTDLDGRFLLTNRAPNSTTTTYTGHNLHASPYATVNVVGGESVFLIEVSRPGGNFDYAWMDLTQFNLAYWNGNTTSWTYNINTHLGTSPLPRITDLNAAVEANSVTLTWPAAAPGASSYRVYRASPYINRYDDPTHIYENWGWKPLSTQTGTSYTDTTIFETSRYAVVARDGSGHEAPLSNRLFAPILIHPWAVGVQADNQRAILDPQNGYALMRQDAQGRYIGNFGSVHYHLEYSYFMAVDKGYGRLIISHPADQYSGRHSIRVSDLNGNAITEFGDYGTNPGQFNTPSGVAVDAEHRIYVMDRANNRLEIFNSGGTLITTYGGPGSGAGQFNYPQGIAVDSRHQIYVCDNGNARVQVLQFNGSSVSYVGTLPASFSSPTGVAVGAGDYVFVTDYNNSRVEAFSPYGNWLRSYEYPTDVYTGHLQNPTGIAVDNNGLLVVCDTGKRRVVTISTAGLNTVAGARALSDNTAMRFDGKIVTAILPGEGCIYVADPNRCNGMRVIASGAGLAEGDVVCVSGTMDTRLFSGQRAERQVKWATVTRMSGGTPLAPLAMNCKAVGGAALLPNMPGVLNGVGLNNVGSLVKIAGRASLVISTYIYIDDGSGIQDTSGRTGVMVSCTSTPNVVAGDIVSATGIIEGNIPTGWTTNRRYIQTRRDSDVVKIWSSIPE